ncbi:MAG: ribonuclease H-like domain-containing protein [Fimbriimonadales bacterium]|nr:ribonuclease H-like domain-containing protein [Fimbriimonadales bacterium]
MNIVYFDLETKYLAEEVGGWSFIDRMELAVAVTYSTRRGGFSHYTEAEVGALIDELCNADLVVGFNILRFDYTVLRPYTTRDLRQLPSFDILRDLEQRLGHRVKLDSCAQATLGTAKGGDGKQAVRWFREGQIDKVVHYCKQDVDIVRRLHEYGKQNRHIYIDNFGVRLLVPVSW